MQNQYDRQCYNRQKAGLIESTACFTTCLIKRGLSVLSSASLDVNRTTVAWNTNLIRTLLS